MKITFRISSLALFFTRLTMEARFLSRLPNDFDAKYDVTAEEQRILDDMWFKDQVKRKSIAVARAGLIAANETRGQKSERENAQFKEAEEKADLTEKLCLFIQREIMKMNLFDSGVPKATFLSNPNVSHYRIVYKAPANPLTSIPIVKACPLKIRATIVSEDGFKRASPPDRVGLKKPPRPRRKIVEKALASVKTKQLWLSFSAEPNYYFALIMRKEGLRVADYVRFDEQTLDTEAMPPLPTTFVIMIPDNRFQIGASRFYSEQDDLEQPISDRSFYKTDSGTALTSISGAVSNVSTSEGSDTGPCLLPLQLSSRYRLISRHQSPSSASRIAAAETRRNSIRVRSDARGVIEDYIEYV